METKESETLSGIEELRRTARLLDHCDEGFNQRFDAAQLLALGRAYRACKWDIAPDEWSEEQVQAALAGEVPTFERDPEF